MSYSFNQQFKNIAQVRNLFAAALVLACAFSTVTTRRRKSRLPPLRTPLQYRQETLAYLVGHAFGSQGYTCLPTATGGTAWNPTARPEATLFTDLFGQQFQIITHFQSINENPKPASLSPSVGTRPGRVPSIAAGCGR